MFVLSHDCYNDLDITLKATQRNITIGQDLPLPVDDIFEYSNPWYKNLSESFGKIIEQSDIFIDDADTCTSALTIALAGY